MCVDCEKDLKTATKTTQVKAIEYLPQVNLSAAPAVIKTAEPEKLSPVAAQVAALAVQEKTNLAVEQDKPEKQEVVTSENTNNMAEKSDNVYFPIELNLPGSANNPTATQTATQTPPISEDDKRKRVLIAGTIILVALVLVIVFVKKNK